MSSDAAARTSRSTAEGSQQGNTRDWVTVRSSSSTVAEPDEWLDLADFSDLTVYIDPAPVPPSESPELPRREVEFRGMRHLLGDQWVCDYVPYVDEDGVSRTRMIRFGDSRGWRRGAVLQRAARRMRK